jgi:hypothetical protein
MHDRQFVESVADSLRKENLNQTYGAASVQLLHTQTHTYIQHSRALTTLTCSHTHHVACHSPNVSSNGSSDPSGHLPSPSRGQQPSFAPPSPTNPHAPNCSPSLTSAAPKCTIPAFLHHPVHSHRPSILSRHSSTFQPSCHTCHLHPAAPSRYRPPLPSTCSCHSMYSLPLPSCVFPAFSRVSRPTRQRGVIEGYY